MDVVIVALPAKDESVWDISTEKVPHLTILYLGEDVDRIDQITEYIGEVAKANPHPLKLRVDRRGILGDSKADVLFFSEGGLARVARMRLQMLDNPDILLAYREVLQYDEWTPHLTLGYPEKPAVEGDLSFTTVTFDRLAVWTGDSEGKEFPLTRNTNEAAHTALRGSQFIEHFGVKGMKWGVRRSDDELARETTRLAEGAKNVRAREQRERDRDTIKSRKVLDLAPSKDHRDAQRSRTKAKVSGVPTLSNRDLQVAITRMALERQYKDLKQVEHEESLVGAGKKFARDVLRDVLKDAAASWLQNPFNRQNRGDDDIIRVRSWQTGQNFAREIGQRPRRRAISA